MAGHCGGGGKGGGSQLKFKSPKTGQQIARTLTVNLLAKEGISAALEAARDRKIDC